VRPATDLCGLRGEGERNLTLGTMETLATGLGVSVPKLLTERALAYGGQEQ